MAWPFLSPEAQRDSHRVQIADVANVISLQLTVWQLPYLDQLVPASADNNGIAATGWKADTRHPLRTALIMDSIFAYNP